MNFEIDQTIWINNPETKEFFPIPSMEEIKFNPNKRRFAVFERITAEADKQEHEEQKINIKRQKNMEKLQKKQSKIIMSNSSRYNY